MLLVLLITGWAAGCPVQAQEPVVVEVLPTPDVNLTGSWNDAGTAIQPLETFDISDYGVSFSFSLGSGSNNPAYYNSDSAIRIYRGNKFTINIAEGYTLNQVAFVNTQGDNTTLSVSSGKLDMDEELHVTWYGDGGESEVTFENVTSSQFRFTQVILTVIPGTEVKNKPNAPVLSQKSCTFYEPFELTITDSNEPAATIRYTLDGTVPSADNGQTYTGPITITGGNNVTVKAVAINENGISSVVTATYTYEAKYRLTIRNLNKKGVNYIYVNSNSDYESIQEEGFIYASEGESIYLWAETFSGYSLTSVTMNGTALTGYDDNYEFAMPGENVELLVDSKFDPTSPSDPQPGSTEKKFRLTIVSNPAGSGYIYSKESEYTAGTQVGVEVSPNSGYRFVNWTKDGQSISTNSYFTYTMPAEDVVLTANFVFNPSNPGDPQQPTTKHPLTVVASPAGAGSFYISESEVVYGGEYTVQAYPKDGYEFKGWLVNGKALETTDTWFTGIMTEAGAHVVGLFKFNPSSPSNPGANYYNPETGKVIVDDFTPGNLYRTISTLTGGNLDNISSLTVKGRMNNYDYTGLNRLSNTATVDLSRVGGVSTVPNYSFENMMFSALELGAGIDAMGQGVFSGCSNLTSLTVHAPVPPTCSEATFSGFTNKDVCVLYVPAEYIELYSDADYWKDFVIMPIMNDAHVLQVNLPADASDGRYKHNTIEIVNINSGVRQKYVVSDRLLYTFNGMRKDEQYNVYMYSQAGLEIGRIENVTIPDADTEVSFSNLKMLYNVNAQVLDNDGNDVTSQVTVEWLKPLADGTVEYLRKDVSLGEVPDGQKLICRVTLDSKLGVRYSMPGDVEFTVSESQNNCIVNLQPLRSVELTGTVVDGDNVPMANASVSAVQLLNGKFSKTLTARTGTNGVWTIPALDATQTRMVYSATECVNVTDTLGTFGEDVVTLDLGRKVLKSIVGARISYGFTYQEAGAETAEDTYADFQNVAISVFNVTQNRAHRDVSLQYPLLAVLDENISAGDELKLTATSKTGAFSPIERTVTVNDNQRAEVTFDIIGKGGIAASFEMTENPAVTGMLYNKNGELIKKQTYSEAKAIFTGLEDGEYTLVTMGESDLMNSILRLSNFGEIGMTDGKDYVKNTISVETGKLTEVKNSRIPAFDESLFYYTNDKTGFSVNKSSVITGNYLTLRSTVDFKGVYKNDIRNVALIVDLPEACSLVEQSVIQGPNVLPYTFDNGRLTVQLGDNYQSQTRFCVIPTMGGSFNASASISFEYNGRILSQPIGSAISQIKDIEIKVPNVIAGTTFNVSGLAKANSTVKVFDAGTEVGTGKVNSIGSWAVECELDNPYNLSKHTIYAEITTLDGDKMITESKDMLYDASALRVSKVTMVNTAHPASSLNLCDYTTVYDFQEPNEQPAYWYWPTYPKFTFMVDFTDNNPELISNVILYVHTTSGNVIALHPKYNTLKKCWVAQHDFHSGSLPQNVSVDFDGVTEMYMDNSQLLSEYGSLESLQDEVAARNVEIDELYARIKNELNNEVPDFEVLDDLHSQLATLLNIPTSGFEDADENELYNELEKFKQEYGEGSIDGLMNSKLTSIDYALPEEAGVGNISVSTCDGYELSSVMNDSTFEKFNISGDKQIFAKATENSYILLDFVENVCYTITFESESARAALARAAGDVSQIQKHSNTIGDKIKAANDLLTKLLGAIDEVVAHIDGGLKFAREGYGSSWNQLQKLKRLQAAGENIGKQRIILLELTCDGWEAQVKTLNGIKSGLTNCRAQVLGKLFGACGVISNFVDCKNDLDEFINLYYSVPDPCEKEQSKADNIRSSIRNAGIAAGLYYVANITADVCALLGVGPSIVSAPATGGSSLAVALVAVGKIALSYGINTLYRNSCDAFKNNARNDIASLKCTDKECGEPGMPPCKDDPKQDSDGGGKTGNNGRGGEYQSGCPNTGNVMDPSGYVYEAVPENRVEGVQASIYYKEDVEDMYGDLHENIVLWDAEEYAQKNPLFTDENGMYQWDVPQGLWQVKFEKDGYQTAYSEWLPVPPPQLDVNIGIVQNRQPEITEARAYEEGVEVQFDKYMKPSTLNTDNIYVTANGEKLAGTVSLLDSALADEFADEDDADATRYASRVRFIPETPLSVTTGEIRLTVSRNVLSYAGIPMTQTYSQVLDVEKEVQYITADDVKVLYGGEKQVTVFAQPFDAAVGRTLRIANSSDLIAAVDKTEAVLDEEGKAVITVKGELPGCAQLSFTIDDVTATGECAVDVVTELITAEAPVASRASGTAVYRGSKVQLTTDSKDAVIYFTTDGSCPCDAEGTRRKYTVPIVINDDNVKIIAMTAVGTGTAQEVSETVEFNYTLKKSTMDLNMADGWTWMSHNLESALPVATVAQDAGVSRIMTQEKESVRDPQYGMIGTLKELSAEQSFKVQSETSSAVRNLTDYAWNPASPIGVNAGWNWLGYPVDQTMSLDEAFATTDVDQGDVVVGQTGFAQYDGQNWIGTLQTMEPGKGYMYQSATAKDVVYNTTIVSNAAATTVAGIADRLPVALDIHKYASIMPVVATIRATDGSQLDNDDYQVLAFSGTECRGIGRVVAGNVMMNVYGNAGDAITFRVVDNETEECYANTAALQLHEDIVGSLADPYSISLSGNSGIGRADFDGNVRVYADGDMLRIKGIAPEDIRMVEMFDVTGTKVLHETKVSESGVRLPEMVPGAYVVIVDGNGVYTYHKISVR